MTPQERFDRLKTLVENGVIGKVIAHEFGCYNTQISTVCRVLGIGTKYNKIPDETRAAILREYAAGAPVRALGRKYGLCGPVISRMANKAGLRRLEFAKRPLRKKGVSK